MNRILELRQYIIPFFVGDEIRSYILHEQSTANINAIERISNERDVSREKITRLKLMAVLENSDIFAGTKAESLSREEINISLVNNLGLDEIDSILNIYYELMRKNFYIK